MMIEEHEDADPRLPTSGGEARIEEGETGRSEAGAPADARGSGRPALDPAARPRRSGVVRSALILVAAFAAGLLSGFLPQWLKARGLASELEAARYELEVSRLQSTLGAALAEADRGNYERARQLASSFYTGLEALEGRVLDDAQAEVLGDLSRGRDETITLLSRALPEARGRLANLYARYFAAMEPLGRSGGGSLTTSPEQGAVDAAGAADTGAPAPATRGY